MGLWLWLPAAVLLLWSCGKKKPPVPPSPPPPEAGSLSVKSEGLLKGNGGYFLGDGGYAVLYWSFPTKVDYSVVYEGQRPLATVWGYTFLVEKRVEAPTEFRVVGFRGEKPVAEVAIRVSP
ncbi:MAG: hypothetical protein GXO08_04605 [Aquificae bacterium]|nr:hypothetical protein [Aquificota bacterium]